MHWSREAIETYSTELRRLGEHLVRSMSLVMGMEKDALLRLHQELVQPMSVAYYPPCFMPDKVLARSKSTLRQRHLGHTYARR